LTIADSTIARNNFIGSKYVLDVETFGNAWQDAWTRGPKLNPPVVPQAVLPFAADDGGRPQHFFGKGYLTTTVLKKAAPDRVKELLCLGSTSFSDLKLRTGRVFPNTPKLRQISRRPRRASS
jgi:hypothetical protein